MPRKPKSAAKDTVTFLLRDIDGDEYRRARVRSIIDGREMSEVLRALIRDYGAEKLTPGKPSETTKRRK